MSKRSKIKQEILEEYLKSHRNISDRQLKRVKESIKDIDTRTYERLKTYDAKSGVTNKRKEYVNIMLKNYRKRFGESTKAYKERVHGEKDRLLKNRGIKAISRRTRHLRFKGFAKNTEYSKIKVKNKPKVERRMRKAKESALKSPKKFVSDFLDKLKPSKSKIHMTAPKGLFKKLKDKKEKNPTKFKKYRIRAIIAAALITISIGSYGIYNNFNNTSSPSTSHTYELTDEQASSSETKKSDSVVLEENDEDTSLQNDSELEFNDQSEEKNSTDSHINQAGNSESEISDDIEESTVEEQQKDDTEESTVEEEQKTESETTTSNISASIALRILISNFKIGFDTEFQMENGLFYEAPEETGNIGHYAKFQSSNLKLTYIDAIYEDGRIVQYDASSGLSIADIIKENEGATLSYHVETTDGRILGWNSSSSNNIEAALLLGHLNQLKSYISSEDMEFINSIDFANMSEISKDNFLKVWNIIQTAENTQEQSLNNSIDDQQR